MRARRSNAIYTDASKQPLHVAAATGKNTVVRELLEKGVNTEVTDKDGNTALHDAAKYGFDTVVRTLLDARADPSARDAEGHTALHRAAFYGHAAIIAELLARGAPLDAPDLKGNTALHHAGRGSQEWVFDLLELKHGADASVRNCAGEVPVMQEEPCQVQ